MKLRIGLVGAVTLFTLSDLCSGMVTGSENSRVLLMRFGVVVGVVVGSSCSIDRSTTSVSTLSVRSTTRIIYALCLVIGVGFVV